MFQCLECWKLLAEHTSFDNYSNHSEVVPLQDQKLRPLLPRNCWISRFQSSTSVLVQWWVFHRVFKFWHWCIHCTLHITLQHLEKASMYNKVKANVGGTRSYQFHCFNINYWLSMYMDVKFWEHYPQSSIPRIKNTAKLLRFNSTIFLSVLLLLHCFTAAVINKNRNKGKY